MFPHNIPASQYISRISGEMFVITLRVCFTIESAIKISDLIGHEKIHFGIA